jgi:hypothetical protein
MGNGEQSSSGGRAGWPVRLAAAAGIGAALGLLLVNLVDLRGWGVIAFCAAVGVGTALGRRAGSLLLRKPPGG